MVARPLARVAHMPPPGGPGGRRRAKNEEEIEIGDFSDEEGAPGLGFGTIPNAQDVHVVAAALGHGGVCEVGAENGMHEGAGVKQAGKGSGAAGPALPASMSASSSSSSSSDSSDSEEEEEALDVASYQDMKNLVDEMMGRGGVGNTGNTGNTGGTGGTHIPVKEGNGGFQAPSHPQAHQELFDTSEATLAALRTSLRSLSISTDETLSECGRVVGCLEGTVVVQASLGAANECLAEGSILVTEGRVVLGRIEDIFGPVEAPMYVLMDPSSLYVGENEGAQVPRVQVGDTLWYVESLVKRIVDPKRLREVGVGEDVEIEGGDEEDEEDEGDEEDEEDEEDEGDEEGDDDGSKGNNVDDGRLDEVDGNDEGFQDDGKKAPVPSRPVQHQTQQPRTISEWQSQQQASGQPQGSAGPKPFKPVAFKKAYHK